MEPLPTAALRFLAVRTVQFLGLVVVAVLVLLLVSWLLSSHRRSMAQWGLKPAPQLLEPATRDGYPDGQGQR